MATAPTHIDQLPKKLPIFPLSGAVLLPGGELPLNIFEPRYINMVDHAMANDRMIGMIQPISTPNEKKSDKTLQTTNQPDVYPVGCAGRIANFVETDDGRYLISLSGVCRFEVANELDLKDGFRRVSSDWQRFAKHDLNPCHNCEVEEEKFYDLLGDFFKQHNMSADWDILKTTPFSRLINILSMICPFEYNEKQALLEANTLQDRADVMMTCLHIACQRGYDQGGEHH